MIRVSDRLRHAQFVQRGQRLHPGVGDGGSVEVQPIELTQVLQPFQTLVRDPRVLQPECTNALAFQLGETGVVKIRVVQPQFGVLMRLKMRETAAGDARAGQLQRPELAQSSQRAPTPHR